MKLKLFIVSISAVLFAVISCASSRNTMSIDGEKIIPGDCSQYIFNADNVSAPLCRADGRPAYEGFIGKKYLRVIAVGRPKESTKGVELRRTKSRAAAVLVAQYNAMEKLKGTVEIKQDDGDSKVKVTGFSGIAKAGKVVCEYYDHNDTCALIYDVAVAED